MIKIIFIDVDGTLKDAYGQIPKNMTEVIRQCEKRQIQLCLCTGRSIGTIQKDVLELAIPNVIAGGGNYITIQDRMLYQAQFSYKEIQTFLNYYNPENYALAFECNEETFMNQAAVDIYKRLNEVYASKMDEDQMRYYSENERIVYRNSMHAFDIKQHDVHKICIWCNTNPCMALQEEHDAFQVAQMEQHGEQTYYEIVKKDCDKGSGVRRVLAHYGIPKSMSIGFGNGRNDIEMLQACGCGIAMEDSDPMLKKYAHAICEAAHHDGIYKELKRRNII